MQDAVAVAFEAGAVWVFFFGDGSVTWAYRMGSERSKGG
jgi:hypothetical protein